jgi:preprotein translocase subunit SecG
MVGVMYYVCVSLFIFVCVVMIGLVLLQKGRGGGLASAFGGAGGNTAFGSKTGDVLTWATAILFGIFIALAVALNLLADAKNRAAMQVAIPSVDQTSQPEATPPVSGTTLPATTTPAR